MLFKLVRQTYCSVALQEASASVSGEWCMVNGLHKYGYSVRQLLQHRVTNAIGLHSFTRCWKHEWPTCILNISGNGCKARGRGLHVCTSLTGACLLPWAGLMVQNIYAFNLYNLMIPLLSCLGLAMVWSWASQGQQLLWWCPELLKKCKPQEPISSHVRGADLKTLVTWEQSTYGGSRTYKPACTHAHAHAHACTHASMGRWNLTE